MSGDVQTGGGSHPLIQHRMEPVRHSFAHRRNVNLDRAFLPLTDPSGARMTHHRLRVFDGDQHLNTHHEPLIILDYARHPMPRSARRIPEFNIRKCACLRRRHNLQSLIVLSWRQGRPHVGGQGWNEKWREDACAVTVVAVEQVLSRGKLRHTITFTIHELREALKPIPLVVGRADWRVHD